MNNVVLRDVIITTTLLGLFAAVGAGLVAWVHNRTEARISENQIALTRARVGQLLAGLDYDNDPVAAQFVLRHPLLGPPEATVWFARQGTDVAGLVLSAVSPSGYSGAIHLLVGLTPDGHILGVRVTQHRETPGLGDDIEAERSNWIHGFAGRYLDNPPLDLWRVRRDGGIFDQFTGATVTPRAVVRAVRDVLLYFQSNSEDLLALGRLPNDESENSPAIDLDVAPAIDIDTPATTNPPPPATTPPDVTPTPTPTPAPNPNPTPNPTPTPASTSVTTTTTTTTATTTPDPVREPDLSKSDISHETTDPAFSPEIPHTPEATR